MIAQCEAFANMGSKNILLQFSHCIACVQGCTKGQCSLVNVKSAVVIGYPDMEISRLMGEFELETYTPEDFDPYVSRPALVFTQRDSGLKGLFYDSKLVYPADYQDIIWGEDGFTLVRGATETLVTWAELDELAR